MSAAIQYRPTGGWPVDTWQPWPRQDRAVRLSAGLGIRKFIGGMLCCWMVLGAVLSVVFPRICPVCVQTLTADNTGSSIQSDIRDCTETGQSSRFCRSVYTPTNMAIGK